MKRKRVVAVVMKQMWKEKVVEKGEKYVRMLSEEEI